jgi:peptidoglycan-associated lipoprotein
VTFCRLCRSLFGTVSSGYYSIFFSLRTITMRATLPVTILLSAMLAACASSGDLPPNKHISQSATLRVHPGLLGQAVPAEPKIQQSPTATSESTVAASTDPIIKMDQAGLRTQRSVYFDVGSADVRSEFDPALQAHARYLAANPKARLRIDGNADERGSHEFNARLGLKRADNVRRAMIQHGAPDKQISAKSLGKAQPKLKGHDEESWAENRRADVIYEKEN